MAVVRSAEIKRKYKGSHTGKAGLTRYSYPSLSVPTSLLRTMKWNGGKVAFQESYEGNYITMTRPSSMLTLDDVKAMLSSKNKQTEQEQAIRKELESIPPKFRVTTKELDQLVAALDEGKRTTGRLRQIQKMYHIWFYFEKQRLLDYDWNKRVKPIMFPRKDGNGGNKSEGTE